MKKEWIGVSMVIVSLAIGIPMYVKSQVVNPHAASHLYGAGNVSPMS